MTSRWSFAFLAVFALARGIGCSDDYDIRDENNFREDVILCEHAVTHVEQCCPDVRAASDACVYRHLKRTTDCGACSSGTEEYEERVQPVLAIATSEGILDTSCADLSAWEGCSRLQAELTKENRWSEMSGNCNDSTGRF